MGRRHRARPRQPKGGFTQVVRQKNVTDCVEGVWGIDNQGNTCYLNAALQALMATPGLRRAAEEAAAADSLGKLMRAFCGFVMATGQPKPTALLEEVRRHAPGFGGHRQQDAHELFSVLVRGAEHEYAAPERPPQTSSPKPKKQTVAPCPDVGAEGFARPPGKAAQYRCSVLDVGSDGSVAVAFSGELPAGVTNPVRYTARQWAGNSAWRPATEQRPDSPVLRPEEVAALNRLNPFWRLFRGELVSEVRCSDCGTASRTLEPCYNLSVPLTGSVAESLGAFFGAERVSQYDCDECAARLVEKRCSGMLGAVARAAEGARVGIEALLSSRVHGRRPSARKRYHVEQLPQTLVIQIDRFAVTESGRCVKEYDRVVVPDTVDMASHAGDPASQSDGELTAACGRLGMSAEEADKAGRDGCLRWLREREASCHKYNLYAAVEHSGGYGSGHYVAYVRAADGGWLLCNDRKVQVCSGVVRSARFVLPDRAAQTPPPTEPVAEADGTAGVAACGAADEAADGAAAEAPAAEGPAVADEQAPEAPAAVSFEDVDGDAIRFEIAKGGVRYSLNGRHRPVAKTLRWEASKGLIRVGDHYRLEPRLQGPGAADACADLLSRLACLCDAADVRHNLRGEMQFTMRSGARNAPEPPVPKSNAYILFYTRNSVT